MKINKKFFKRGLSFALAMNMIVPVVSASFDEIKDETLETYESKLTKDEKEEVESSIEIIQNMFQNIYDLMLTDELDIKGSITKERSFVTLAGLIYEIDAKVDELDSTYDVDRTLKAYYNEKIKELKSLYESYEGADLEEFEEFLDSNEVEVIMYNGKKTIAVSAKKEAGSSSHTGIEFYDYPETFLPLSKMVTFKNYDITNKTTANKGANISYETYGISIFNTNFITIGNKLGTINQAFNKIEEAIEKGNYNVTSSLDKESAVIAIIGDVNKLKENLEEASLTEGVICYKFIQEKEDLIFALASNKINGIDYNTILVRKYKDDIIRETESNNYIYYSIDNEIISIPNKGLLTEKDLEVEAYSINNTYSGINYTVNGEAFFPNDVNGNYTESYIIDNEYYVPIGILDQLFNFNITYNGGVIEVITNNYSTYYEEYRVNSNYNRGEGIPPLLESVEINPTLLPLKVNGEVKSISLKMVNGTTLINLEDLEELFGLDYTISGNTINIKCKVNPVITVPTPPVEPTPPIVVPTPNPNGSYAGYKYMKLWDKDTGLEVKVYILGNGNYATIDGKNYNLEELDDSFSFNEPAKKYTLYTK